MITVHHLNKSRSQRVLWLLEELEVPYELVKYEREPKTLLAPPELQKIHPLGKSPVITDGDVTVAESGAILEYIVETYGNGRLVPPANTAEFRHYRYFMRYAEGSLMPYLLLTLIFDRVRTAPVPFFVKPIARKIADKVNADFVAPNLTRHLKFLGDHLAKHTWFAGAELTAADIQMSYAVEAIASRLGHMDVSPKIRELAKRMQERPAFKRAVAKGGPSIPE
ncbi:glutathione S-transferase [Microcella sp.]|uniref:glutathione S-transferase family protein n=1 Tax=Microcella sp. TaxID=1913979 RepID=UPI00299F6E87|nr:glutathione S-transferase [Microcella sp.]MDX2026980.1 glutathione S-transferase [Microcella sp.]